MPLLFGFFDFSLVTCVSLSYSTALVLNAGTDNVYLICVFIRFISCLLRKVKYCPVSPLESFSSVSRSREATLIREVKFKFDSLLFLQTLFITFN